jgi:hypothetical protein
VLRPARPALVEFAAFRDKRRYTATDDMIELNPVRQRIADLRGRLDALRGYL